MKTLCLYNPLARKVRGSDIFKLLKGRDYWGDVYFHALSPIDLTEPKWLRYLDDAKQVLILGGDGTLHHVAQFLVHRDTLVHIIPYGTANDLGRWIGLGSDLLQNTIALETGKTVAYDAITANGRYVFSGGGFGLGYLIAENSHHLSGNNVGWLIKKLAGTNLYTLLLIWNIIRHPIIHYMHQCRLGDSKKEVDTPLVVFTNQAILGKGVLLAPDTMSTDGRYQLIIFRNTNSRSILLTLCGIKLKLKRNDPWLDRSEVQQITLEWRIPVPAFADGELLPPEKTWKIICHRGALKLRVPITFNG